MMKRLFILLLILCSLAGYGQTFPVTVTNGTVTTGVRTRGALYVDSALLIPIKDTTWTPARAGSLTMRPQDTLTGVLHVFSGATTGKKWYQIAGSAASIDSFTYATRRYVDSSVSALPTLYTANGTLSGNRTVTMGSYGLNFYKDASNYANLTSTTIDMRRGKLYLYGDNTFGQMRLRTSGFEYNAWNNVYENNDSSFTAGIYSSNEKNYNWKQAQFEANWQDGATWKVAAYWKTNSTISGMKGWTMRHTSTDGQAEIHTDRETFTVGSSTDSALVRKSDGTIGLYPVGGGGGASSPPAVQTFTDGATITLDYNTTSGWKGTIAGNRSFTLSNIPSNGVLNVTVTQDATGNRVPTFSGVTWLGTPPDWPTTGGKSTVCSFWNDGATIWGTRQNQP